ncbi:D-alanine--D-alanine ligase family protein [Pararhodospirillum oryzae]|uniref:ATP-grasp domain-containing protein n=1 Tax=Pararhodospirillum oryzae TaxID=478448 RepID=A0A512H3I0_9PROT|nr:hypothetical protein [Pararhodospirillum oryzae]GEO80019.1 hypothetical protein ROR02_01500 [Pararhodospirillum oryzae]
MVFPRVPDRLLRPRRPAETRLLLLARHAPLAPAHLSQDFPGDGGYPKYYHRVWSVLVALGYDVTTATHPLAVLEAASRVDGVFSLYNRMPGPNPEVVVPALCGYLGVPVVGAPANIRALAEDKWLAKLALRAQGLPTTLGVPYASEAELATAPPFPGPYFVKNRFGAASEGITDDSIQDTWAGAARAAAALIGRGMSVLVEEYVPGIDITVPVLGGTDPLVLGVVCPGSDKTGGIITEDLKRDDPLGYALASPDDARDTALAGDVAALWQVTGPMDYTRLDYRWDPATGRRAFLEFNVCCHIGRSGAICLAARAWGLDQADVLGHVVECCLARCGRGDRS